MQKSYHPEEFEDRLYQEWEKAQYFEADDSSTAPSFTIPMPPPNVTGALHNGHALFVTLQDSLVRWKRMLGYNVLWQPGIDHAGIATQMVVERELAKSKINRHQLGREEFLKKVWEWKEKHGGIIFHQMRKLGASADWKRSRFTMDEENSVAVRKVFVDLYQEGLIYRGTRLTNRCVRCETVLSDLEVETKERKSSLWQIRYWTADKKHSVVVATTRPETLLGDTAVAVHPDDERYQQLIGQKLRLPLLGREIPLIADAYVEKDFGTGVLKVTPGHDFNDYEIGNRHSLPIVSIMNLKGILNENAGPYQGLKVAEARERVLKDLEAAGDLVQTQEITQQAGFCQRCDTLVEPLISDQWFMKMEPLARPVIEAAKLGERLTLQECDERTDVFKIVPESWNATFYHWMENIRDWCISRQLWWGHRIPAWYCQACKKVTVSMDDAKACEGCGSTQLTQDEDVLDTWFSSGLWPFATLGWPKDTVALQKYYPASVMETGSDILFFWVARMLMMGMKFNDGKVPFPRIYLHSMVRDEKGQKMSKTKGNVIDPLDLIKDYGADAFRMTLVGLSGQGRDVRLSVDRIEGYRAFCTKLWNASRYVFMRLGTVESEFGPGKVVNLGEVTQGMKLEDWVRENRSQFHEVNRWMLSRLDQTAKAVHGHLDRFEMSHAANEIYSLVWNDFCDWTIEFSKELLKDGPREGETQVCLVYALEKILLLCHPFIPFVTDEIYRHLPEVPGGRLNSIMVGRYPSLDVQGNGVDEEALTTVALWQDAIARLRAFRGENNISPKARPDVTYESLGTANLALFEKGLPLITAVAQLGSLNPEMGALKGRLDTGEIPSQSVLFRMGLKGLVDFSEELKRLVKQRDRLIADVAHIDKKLGNPSFVERAPPELLQAESGRKEALVKEREVVESSIEKIQRLIG